MNFIEKFKRFSHKSALKQRRRDIEKGIVSYYSFKKSKIPSFIDKNIS